MKAMFLLMASLFSLNSFGLKLYSDSVKIFKTSDTAYYLGVYGVVLPSGPCTIANKSITFSNDSIEVSICFLYGNSQSFGCDASDTVFLGNLNDRNYYINVYLASSDTVTNTCSNPNRADTINFLIRTTDLPEIPFGEGFLVYNPSKKGISGFFKRIDTIVWATITSLQGNSMIADVPIYQPSFEIDVSILPAGIYFLQLSNGKQRVVRKFVKE